MRVHLTRGDGIDALFRGERPRPEPGPGQVRVAMRAASLNYRDLLVINGVGSWRPPEPRVPLSDGVGVVDAVGPGVTRLAVGDRVAGLFLPRWLDGELTEDRYVRPLGGAAADGVLADAVVFDADAVVRVPAHLDDTEAATLPVAGLTAWHALTRCGVAAGDTVLIEGTGGVSLFALQFAHALGARTVVLSSRADKLERARALGADHGIDYRATPEWEREVLALTGGRGVDHVIEVVGGEHLNRALRVVRIGGRIAFVGLLAGLAAPIDTYRFVTRNVTLHGIETGSRAMAEAMHALMARHALRPVIDREYPVDEVVTALRRLERGEHVGKIVLRY